jgi:hypothetical protein
MNRFSLFLLLTLLPQAALAVDVAILGGLNYAAPSENISGIDQKWTGDAAVTYGIDAALPVLALPLALQTGLYFGNSSSEQSLSGNASTRLTHWTLIPLQLNYYFDERISFGAGGYFAFSRGEIETTTNGTTTSQSYDSAKVNTSDSGLLVNVRAFLHIAPPVSIVLDARYLHGLSNRSLISGSLSNTRSVQLLAGALYEFL